MKLEFRGIRRSAGGDPVRRTAILRAARTVFIRDGSSGFSARGVAKEAGMSLGNLQHFYATKDTLLAGMLEYVFDKFQSDYERVLAGPPHEPEERLLTRMDQLVLGAFDPDNRRLFLGFYALASQNRFADMLVDQMLERMTSNTAALISAARPSLSHARCLEIAVQLAALIEGLMLFTSTRGAKRNGPEALIATVRRSVRQLIALDAA